MAPDGNHDPLAELDALASEAPSKTPVWEFKMLPVRSHIVGREESFVRAVELHGPQRVARLLTETVGAVSRFTVSRIYKEIKRDGRIKVPGVRAAASDRAQQPVHYPADIDRGSDHTEDLRSVPAKETSVVEPVIPEVSRVEEKKDNHIESKPAVDFIGGKSDRESVERVPSSGRITRKEQEAKVMQKIREDANGGRE